MKMIVVKERERERTLLKMKIKTVEYEDLCFEDGDVFEIDGK